MLELQQVYRVDELLLSATQHLSTKNIKDCKLNAERLLCKTLNMSRVDLYMNTDLRLTPELRQNFYAYLKRREQHEPLQYILGQTEFMSLPFMVEPGVLVPRPETELLVESVMKQQKSGNKPTNSVLDIGTGSGCIAVSLAKYLEQAHVLALDISETALEIARKNAKLNDVAAKITFAKADIFRSNSLDTLGKVDVIVSNPPYVSKDEYRELPEEIRKYEPEFALTEQGDGLTFYRRLAQIAPVLLNQQGFLAIEIGASQAEQVIQILEKPFNDLSVYQDLTGHDRVITGKYTGRASVNYGGTPC